MAAISLDMSSPMASSSDEFEPVYGCEHIQSLVSADSSAFQTISHQYAAAGISAKKPRMIGEHPLRSNFSCLQCGHEGSAAERDHHVEDKSGHFVFVESRSSSMFCGLCEDFIYDPEMERVRKYGVGVDTTKKRKSENADLLKTNSNKRACGQVGIRGLFNLGQTCYMNVILQSLLHNSLLTSYFLQDGHKAHSCTISSCLGCGLSEAFAEFHSGEKTEGWGAVALLLSTWLTNQNLAGYQQQDAHEFFQFLVDKLHTSTSESQEVNRNDCRCFFHKAFFGKLRSTVTCNQCQNSTKVDDPIVDLSLDMQIQAKKRALESSKSPAATLTLDSCLKSYTATERLVADAYSCQICDGTPQPATKTLKLRKLPAILCLQLKRFEHSTASSKVEGKLDFPMELNMLPYTTKPTSKGFSNYLYDLQSAIIHKGKIDAGHYIAYCRQGNEWFLFDDDKITVATEGEVLGADAYLLFYSLRALERPKNKGKM